MRIISLTKAEQVRQAILLQILSGELRRQRLKAGLSKELGVSQAAAAPFDYIVCNRLEALPSDYLGLAEHQYLIHAMEQAPETASRVTRNKTEDRLRHSSRVLEPVAAPVNS